MGNGSDTLYTYTGDASSVMETFDEISAGLSSIIEDIQAVADAASELTMLEDVLAGLADELDALDGTATGATAALGDVAATSDEAAASLQTLGASGEELATLTAAMDEMSAMTQQGAADAATLSDAVSMVGTDASAAADEIGTFNASIATTAASIESAAASADVGTGSMEAMGAAAEGASGMMDGLQAAMGPLMMIGAVAALAGGQLIGMGLAGQKGEVLLRGMAGASQADINALQADALNLGVSMDQAAAGFYEVESAGYAGSQAITVFDAASRLALGGAANQQDVMSGLTAIMHDYNASADQATQYTDYMAEAVLRGKQSMQDFSSNIGALASAGENVGISFDQVAAAEATMTQISPKVGLDAQQLTSLFKFLSPTMGGVEKAAKGLGLAFDAQKYSSLDLLGKLQYLSDISGGTSTAAFIKLTGGVRGSTAAIDLLKNNAQAFKDNLDAMGHSAGATANAFAQYEDSIPGHLDKASAALSVFGTRLMDAIGPGVGPLIDAVTSGINAMSDAILKHMDIAIPVLAGLATMFGVILVAAIAAFVGPLILAAAPFIAVAAAIGVLVVGITLLVSHWQQISAAIGGNPVFKDLEAMLRSVGAFLVSSFTPVWQQLTATFQTQLIPAWNDLVKAIQPAIPAFELVGAIIGGVLVVSLGLLVAVIGGIIGAIAGMLPGLIQAFGGVVQIVSGVIQIILGIIGFFVDLATGHFNRLGADLGTIWHGILTMLLGLWNVIAGAFSSFTGIIAGFISSFVTTIVGYFTNLWHMLVGGSIVPDMINGIVSWFEQLPGRVGAFVLQLITEGIANFMNFNSQVISLAISLVEGFIAQIAQMPGRIAGVFNALVSTALGILNGLASSALNAGANIVKNIAAGITNAIGDVGNAISSVTNFIASHLPSSPAKIGPLTKLIQQGAMITEQVSTGMLSNLPKLQDALKQLTSPIALNLNPSSLAPSPSTLPSGPTGAQGLGGNNQVVQLLAQILAAQQRQQVAPPTSNTLGAVQQQFNSNTFNGVQDVNTLYQVLNALQGLQGEYAQRGAVFNY